MFISFRDLIYCLVLVACNVKYSRLMQWFPNFLKLQPLFMTIAYGKPQRRASTHFGGPVRLTMYDISSFMLVWWTDSKHITSGTYHLILMGRKLMKNNFFQITYSVTLHMRAYTLKNMKYK